MEKEKELRMALRFCLVPCMEKRYLLTWGALKNVRSTRVALCTCADSPDNVTQEFHSVIAGLLLVIPTGFLVARHHSSWQVLGTQHSPSSVKDSEGQKGRFWGTPRGKFERAGPRNALSVLS